MKILIAFLLTASISLADQYVCVFIDNTIPDAGVDKVLQNVYELGSDNKLIDKAKMPVWHLKANTNTTGRVICIRTDDLGVNGWRMKGLSTARQQIKDGLKLENKQKVVINNKIVFKENYAPENQQ